MKSELYQDEMRVPGISRGKPEFVVQREISRLAKAYNIQRLDDLLSYYPRFARKLRKLEKVYLDRFHKLAPEELHFFLKTYPDFLLSYIVRPLETDEETRISTCKDWMVLSETAQKNLMERFPYRGNRIQEQCGSYDAGSEATVAPFAPSSDRARGRDEQMSNSSHWCLLRNRSNLTPWSLIPRRRKTELYREEMHVPGISHGKPEPMVNGLIFGLARNYDVERLDTLLTRYPRYARKLRKLEKVYLDRYHRLAPEELKFFLMTYPDFLLSYIVEPVEKEKKISTCIYFEILSTSAKKNLAEQFPERANHTEEMCLDRLWTSPEDFPEY
ncbi:hypothetical protein Y032_0005g2648 [Ancylostoma ceylanicum]|uniref:Uncharacterized protein n=2 Tax=Ancylostoma ceylanicum TaxID=53326 RepID=A0A016VTQ9_9BILA|nr:hypothetical protein Y032_0005g2648 [Ancylostoma ceylanicum]